MKVIQIGSNKGNDDLSNYLQSNFTKLDFGLFVEPNPAHIDELKACYSNYDNAIIENVAIKSPDQTEEELEIFYNTHDAVGIMASCKLEHVMLHTRTESYFQSGEIKSFKIPCLTLENLLDNYNITYLDWILLDVEGLDAEILLTFNWKKYNIRKVEFEHVHLGEHRNAVQNMFIEMGYERVNSLHSNDWAYENKNINQNTVV